MTAMSTEFVDVSDTKKVYYGHILMGLIRKWYWIVLCGLIGFGLAYVYAQTVIPVYRISTALVINTSDEELTPGNGNIMSGMNLFMSNRSFYNEVTVINSYPIVLQALTNLNFEVSYFEKELLRTRELYQDSPFIVVFNPGHPQPTGIRIHVTFLGNNRIRVSAQGKDIVTYSFHDKTEIERIETLNINEFVSFGEELSSTHYRFRIIPNSNVNFRGNTGKSYYFTINNLGGMATFYKSSMNVSLYSEQSTVAIVELLSYNTDKGIQFLNSLTQEYMRENLAKKNHMAQATIDYINRQLDLISDSLTVAEEKLQEFRTRYQIHNLDSKAEQIYNQLQILQSDKATLSVKQRYYNSIKDHFDNNEDISDLIAPSSMGIDDPLLGNLVSEFIQLNSQKTTLIENNQENSPYLKSLEIKMDNLRNTIYENIKYNLSTNEFSLEDLDDRINRLNRELSSLPATERQLLGIQREFNLQDEVYNYLLQRRAEAQIAKASNLPIVDIVEPPRVIGNSPVLPKEKIICLIGLVIGGLIPALIIGIRQSLAKDVRSIEEVERISKLPMVGSIIDASDTKKVDIFLSEPNALVTEYFRKVLPNLRYFKADADQLTILLTSSVSGEGKSFISYNLASAFAMQKRNTILLSFDLRKSVFYEKLGYNMEKGVSTALINKTDLDESIQITSIPYFSIIPPGPTPPNPSELIASKETGNIISELKQRYEVIIIDTPPVGLLADARYLMELADINIYAIRMNYTPRNILNNSLQELERKEIKNLCLLINGVTPKSGRYNHYYKYYKSET
jgi:capsular exopolysaccharide synthesis family protein